MRPRVGSLRRRRKHAQRKRRVATVRTRARREGSRRSHATAPASSTTTANPSVNHSWIELATKPHARDRPFATDSCSRNAERGRGFRYAESREVAQLDEPRLLRIQQRESGKSFVERDNVQRVGRRGIRRRRGRSGVKEIAVAQRDL